MMVNSRPCILYKLWPPSLDVVGLVHDDTLELGLEPASNRDTIQPKHVLQLHIDVQMLSVSF